jgi:hypothetical protein
MAADTDADCRIAAIEGLGGHSRQDSRVLISLVDGMENADPAIRLASYDALVRIVGKDVGPEPRAWRDLVEGQAQIAAAPPTAPDTPSETAAAPAAPADAALQPAAGSPIAEPPVPR